MNIVYYIYLCDHCGKEETVSYTFADDIESLLFQEISFGDRKIIIHKCNHHGTVVGVARLVAITSKLDDLNFE